MAKHSSYLKIIYLALILFLGYFLLNSLYSVGREGLDNIAGNVTVTGNTSASPIENVATGTNVMINAKIILKDNTKPQSDPNPNGYFQIQTNFDKTESHFTMNDASAVTLTMDPTKETIISIEPAPIPGGPSEDKHKKDMFPIKFNLKMTFDKSGPVFKYLKDGENENVSKNTVTKNQIDIIRMGKIYDDQFNSIGIANTDTDNPMLFKINIDNSKDITKLNIHFNAK